MVIKDERLDLLSVYADLVTWALMMNEPSASGAGYAPR
jgi:hypothetical protein